MWTLVLSRSPVLGPHRLVLSHLPRDACECTGQTFKLFNVAAFSTLNRPMARLYA
ncbi:hypothetical protein BC826DRAFT_1057989, partial [Russula brevipes]